MLEDDRPTESVYAQAAKLRGILESAVPAIITITDRGLIESVNPSTERLFGYGGAELIRQNVKVLMPEPYRGEHDAYINSYLTTGHRKIIGIGREVMGRRKDGTTFPLHLSVNEFEAGGRRYFTGMIYDLTDRMHVEEALKETERRLAQSQKMEAVGQLTGGIAHDFNNLLMVISGNLELLDERVSNSDDRALLREAQDAAGLASKLTDQLLTFARQRRMDAQVIQVNELVNGIAGMLRRTIGEHIDVSTSLQDGLWEIRADPHQFQSAIINMAVNARDVMPSGGRLIVETHNVVLDQGHVDFLPELTPGGFVQVSISDTGSGMSPEVRDRVFEPFFTTKEKGRGTGLGLAMVYGFVKQSGGHITVYSEVGHGTTFTLYFPRSEDIAERDAGSDEAPQTHAGAREIVLIVEDDERVRRLTAMRLKMLGYGVIEASDGPSALEVLKRTDVVDLVLTDLVMPGGLTGHDVALRAREIRPGIKVLLTSGYSEELAHEGDLQREALKVLRKPYRQGDLAIAVREVLRGMARLSLRPP
jgi:PAS domain S-box-containing protein